MLATDKCTSSAPQPIIISSSTTTAAASNKPQTKSQCHATEQDHHCPHNTSHTHTHSHAHSHPLLQHTHKIRAQSQCDQKYAPDTPRRNLHEMLLEVLDVLLTCLVIAPCVIAYWRGTWELMGVVLFPSSLPLSAMSSFVIGGAGHFIFTVTQNFFKDHIHPDKRRLTYYAISRLYTAIFGIVCVNMWRGAWMICDWLTSVDSLAIISIVTLIALLFLLGTRTLRNLGAAPYTVSMDHKSDYFEVDTMFKIPGFSQPGLYVLDTLFSVFVIGSLVVIAWRGVWGIFDLTLFPTDQAKSAWGSLLIGYLTVFVTFILQPLMRYISRRISGLLKLIICDIYYLMCFFGAVNAWRGIWNLCDVYVFPDDRVMSYWITHIIPFLLLVAFKCSNSILVRGVFIDGEGSGADSVQIPIKYVRLHFLRERSKKFDATHHRHSEPPHYYLKADHGPLGVKGRLEKDLEAQHSLIEKSHANAQII